jgi:cytochrome c oxidase assembly protein subunit 15
MGKNDQVFRGVALFTFIVLVVQFLGGTQVRENVDMLETNLVTAEILEELGSLYLFHRSFSLLILVGVLTLLWKGSRSVNKAFLPLCIFNLILVVLQISTGKILEVFDIPGAAQTIHVLISSLLFGSLFLLFLKTREPKKILSRINE